MLILLAIFISWAVAYAISRGIYRYLVSIKFTQASVVKIFTFIISFFVMLFVVGAIFAAKFRFVR